MLKIFSLLIFGILLLGIASASLNESLSTISNMNKECPADYVGCRLCYDYFIDIGEIKGNLHSCISVPENSENDSEMIKQAIKGEFGKVYFQIFGEEMKIEIIPLNETIEIPLNETEINQTEENITENITIEIPLNETLNETEINQTEENITFIEEIISNITEIIENVTISIWFALI